MAMETDAAASFSRLTLISNFGPPPPPSASNPPPLTNGHSISQSQSIDSAMSLETNEDSHANCDGSRFHANGQTRKHSGTSADEGEATYEMEGREEDDDDEIYARNNKFSTSLNSEESKKPVVHVEARLMPRSMMRFGVVQGLISTYIHENFDRLEVGAELEGWREIHALANSVDRLVVTESYEDDDETNVMAASVRELPSREMDGLWDSLIYPDDVKPRLLNYIYTTLLFSDANVDFNIVTWNRYSHGKLVEINSHSLFSKWFSESGKLVQKLFARVTEMVEDESGFVVVLIDEVESLTAARAGAMSGTEPSDALRVVNALLTQLDKLKHRKNVLVMSTSNIAQAIDSAFIDRADIKQYIGLPPPQAVYWILSGCLTELMRAGIIQHLDLLEWKDLQIVKSKPSQKPERERVRQASLRIAGIANNCEGMSGRTLRRLPVLAHARYIGNNTTDEMHESPVEDWIDAMERVVTDEGTQMRHLEEAVGTGKI
ncbi:hypothetical protein QFC20_005337 [Naganishia adeliensis]|uniref:Uncharacterized protein n=1 Tax=Naganishia adeliensis TaxID=92952 RepID=A0ACC2VQB9_9TREE|nr:hypothetical protein QFC20_005337 [Naganishia adeliensis]